MTISKKILGGYAIVLLMMAIAIITGFYSIHIIRETYDRFIELNERLITGADEIRFEVRDQIAHYRAVLLYPRDQKEYREELRKDYGKFREIIEAMRKLAVTEEERGLLNDIRNVQLRHEQTQEKVISLLQRGRREEAIVAGIKEVRPLSKELIEKADAFREREMNMVAEGLRKLKAKVKTLSVVRSSIFFLAVIFSLTSGFFFTRAITLQLREGISRISSSAAEILATTTQVASSTAETATSVSETTATVEEVKQTSLLSAEKSRGVSETAQKAIQIARQGDAAVNETVEGINNIRGLMEAVVESIVKLSEQTQTIGEIITAVNDLAQQSNLLSVNAAIEASKAGEQGKGFTVVAQEIKSMADQSRQATEQVRTILTDIQKATGAAVMSAEQVSKAVDSGVKQAAESGEAIKRLAESITEAAQAATQIAASSQQQLAGMEQVALAMENIKQATQQNMAGTKQAEQAAHNLNELGQKLKGLVGRDKV